MDGNEEIARRVIAARALAGLKSVQALAAKIDEPGLSTKTLRGIEQARRPAAPRELAAIAKACGIHVAFFRMDLTKGGEPIDEHDMKLRVQNLETQTASLVNSMSRVGARLSQLDERLRLLETDAEAREWEADGRDEGDETATARPHRRRPR